MVRRICISCGLEKDNSYFPRDTNNLCIDCERLYLNTNGEPHPDRVKLSPEYEIWRGIKKRCSETQTNPEVRKHYVDKNIKMCDRWKESYLNFLEDMGPRPGGVGENGRALYSIERTDNKGDYDPDNCVWATNLEQNRNRSNTSHVELNGELITVSEIKEITGLNYSTIRSRLNRGAKTEDLLKPRYWAMYEYDGGIYTAKELAVKLGKCRKTIKAMELRGDIKRVEGFD